ncbi:MAG: 4-(cytidine 5'-diphospho)-2-C-methyl-D-erythritol kinase [Phycisphaeraceae bacterium]|nr:4-(cytidine 5'-diphospho)-2-C-methyl-D-erythritol kinase [Phycisphaeraceae bacterium]
MNQPCHAKVNLALSVGPVGADRLHPIASWMVKLDFADELVIERTDVTQFTLRFADDAPQPQPIDWPLENDLAYRAHQLLEQHVGRPLPIRATLTKRIPAGAGLGGGSSDAGAMMRAVNELFELKLSDDELIALASQLGSDVAFAVSPHRAALVTDYGQQLEPIATAKNIFKLILILPPQRCPTGAVYQVFDELGGATLDEPRVRALTKSQHVVSAQLFNDLAAAAMRVEPKLAEAHARVSAVVNRPVHVTGSGAAMFSLADSAAQARQLAAAITQKTALAAVAARSL